MAAYGSESGRSDNAPQTAGVDPKPSFRQSRIAKRIEMALAIIGVLVR